MSGLSLNIINCRHWKKPCERNALFCKEINMIIGYFPTFQSTLSVLTQYGKCKKMHYKTIHQTFLNHCVQLSRSQCDHWEHKLILGLTSFFLPKEDFRKKCSIFYELQSSLIELLAQYQVSEDKSEPSPECFPLAQWYCMKCKFIFFHIHLWSQKWPFISFWQLYSFCSTSCFICSTEGHSSHPNQHTSGLIFNFSPGLKAGTADQATSLIFSISSVMPNWPHLIRLKVKIDLFLMSFLTKLLLSSFVHITSSKFENMKCVERNCR